MLESIDNSCPTAYVHALSRSVMSESLRPYVQIVLGFASRNSIQYGFCLFDVFLSFLEHFLTVWHSKIFQVNISFSAQLWNCLFLQ